MRTSRPIPEPMRGTWVRPPYFSARYALSIAGLLEAGGSFFSLSLCTPLAAAKGRRTRGARRESNMVVEDKEQQSARPQPYEGGVVTEDPWGDVRGNLSGRHRSPASQAWITLLASRADHVPPPSIRRPAGSLRSGSA